MQFERGWLIGDPHLGRKFEVGVPAHRRGEREARQLRKFIEQLAAPGDMVVMVGDLFDNPYVSHTIVKQAIDAVLAAAINRPSTLFIMMAGNHDMPRKVTATAAFNVFKVACHRRYPNLFILTKPALIGEVAFFPWEWDRNAVDQVTSLARTARGSAGPVAAVGHWDLSSFGGEDLHLAPVVALRDAFGTVPLYSGHYHAPRDYVVDGVTIHGTGSLEPYGHGEDPEGLIYVTMTLAEALAAPPDSLRDKCVRITLAPGEEKPTLDAFAVTAVPAQRVQSDNGGGSLSLDKFDWPGIVRAALDPLDPEVRAFIQERLPNGEEQRRGGDQAD